MAYCIPRGKASGDRPRKTLKVANDKIQVLNHADQWKESDNTDIMALKPELQKQKQDSEMIVCNLVAHVSQLTNAHHHNNNNNGQRHPLSGNNLGINNHNYPPWMTVPPQHPLETKLMDRHIYTWCTKCWQGQGLWVCRHSTETHVDGYNNNCNQ
jgi:hypothetical protein